MAEMFLKLLNMSITASWLVVAVAVLRLILKKAPKWSRVVMWSFVGVRLVFPFSVESVLSLIPTAQPVPDELIAPAPTLLPSVSHGAQGVTDAGSVGFIPQTPALADTPPTFAEIAVNAAAVIWILGMIAMGVYAAVSYLRILRKVSGASPVEGGVWQCERIDTPFILGFIRPRIYLPADMPHGDRDYVLAHERAHLRRGDHLWKPIGFILLSVYWFNPLIWVAYILLCRDIEFACDEKVIKEMGKDAKKPYSNALINCGVPKKMISACPLAFGETGVKERIKGVLHYKKPAVWIIALSVVVCIALVLCFLTDPLSPKAEDGATEPDTEQTDPAEGESEPEEPTEGAEQPEPTEGASEPTESPEQTQPTEGEDVDGEQTAEHMPVTDDPIVEPTYSSVRQSYAEYDIGHTVEPATGRTLNCEVYVTSNTNMPVDYSGPVAVQSVAELKKFGRVNSKRLERYDDEFFESHVLFIRCVSYPYIDMAQKHRVSRVSVDGNVLYIEYDSPDSSGMHLCMIGTATSFVEVSKEDLAGVDTVRYCPKQDLSVTVRTTPLQGGELEFDYRIRKDSVPLCEEYENSMVVITNMSSYKALTASFNGEVAIDEENALYTEEYFKNNILIVDFMTYGASAIARYHDVDSVVCNVTNEVSVNIHKAYYHDLECFKDPSVVCAYIDWDTTYVTTFIEIARSELRYQNIFSCYLRPDPGRPTGEPITEPTVTEPEVTDPPATEPPTTEPTEPPVTEPPATEPTEPEPIVTAKYSVYSRTAPMEGGYVVACAGSTETYSASDHSYASALGGVTVVQTPQEYTALMEGLNIPHYTARDHDFFVRNNLIAVVKTSGSGERTYSLDGLYTNGFELCVAGKLSGGYGGDAVSTVLALIPVAKSDMDDFMSVGEYTEEY